jgi:hypothetical protein
MRSLFYFPIRFEMKMWCQTSLRVVAFIYKRLYFMAVAVVYRKIVLLRQRSEHFRASRIEAKFERKGGPRAVIVELPSSYVSCDV